VAKRKVEVFLEEEDIIMLDEIVAEHTEEGLKTSRSFLICRAVKEFIIKERG